MHKQEFNRFFLYYREYTISRYLDTVYDVVPGIFDSNSVLVLLQTLAGTYPGLDDMQIYAKNGYARINVKYLLIKIVHNDSGGLIPAATTIFYLYSYLSI